MIHVDLDKILTAKGLQEHLGAILFDVEEKEELYVITKKGRPRAALINLDYLQELTGKDLEEGKEYEHYPEAPMAAGVPQSATPPPPTAAPESVIEPAAPAAAEPAEEEVTYPDLDIDSLEIPEEEPETPEPLTEVVMPVPPVTPAPIAPPTSITTPEVPNLAPTPDQVPPPAAPTPLQ